MTANALTAPRRLERMLAGYYKVYQGERREYANIVKRPNGWHGEIRNAYGELVRYAGISRTLSLAIEEVEFIMSRRIGY